MTSFADAVAVKAVDSHTYTGYFPSDWCIGKVPHGGFVTSAFLQVAYTHFRTTLAHQTQPHTITLHLEFLRRTQEGPVEFKVRDAKIGRQTSVIHVILSQDGVPEVEGYLTNSNMSTESGPTFKTPYELQPAPYPVKLSLLPDDGDNHWARTRMPYSSFRKASTKAHFYFPRDGQLVKGTSDQWMRFSTGERFTNQSLGFVADMFLMVVESYYQKNVQTASAEEKSVGAPSNWYPTLLLNLEVKKPLPEEGVEWLFSRVQSKQIKNGRLDLEVIIMDEHGDIVALSNHVSLILGSERNTAQRKTKANNESKI